MLHLWVLKQAVRVGLMWKTKAFHAEIAERNAVNAEKKKNQNLFPSAISAFLSAISSASYPLPRAARRRLS